MLCFDGGGLIDVNAEWVAATGYDVFASAGDSWLTAIHPDDRDDASSCVRTAESAADTEINLRLLGAGGSAHWFRGHVRFVGGDGDVMRLLTLTAVGVHRSNEARLLHMSTHDGLTGLANRSKFVGQIKREMAASTGLAGMLFIDLDHFKDVNDHLGHRYGDAVLQAACKRVEKTIRDAELAGRLGGDEIGVFCPQIETRIDMFALAERIGESLATPFQIGTEIVIIDASIGIAFTDDDNVTTVESLIEAADRAMYLAKAAGGGRWATLDEQRPAPTHIDLDGDPFLVPIRAGVDVASASDTIVDHRPARLHADLEAGIVIAQATGMIAQRTGCETSQAALLLRAFATTRNVTVVNAARMVVNRETEIDTDATTRRSQRLEHPSTGPTQIESRQPESPERLAVNCTKSTGSIQRPTTGVPHSSVVPTRPW